MRTSSSLLHVLEWTPITYESAHDCVVSSTIAAFGLLCDREVASDVLKQVGDSPKRGIKFENSDDAVLAKVWMPARVEACRLKYGREHGLNLYDSTSAPHWILRKSENFVLVTIASLAVGLHTVAVDARPSATQLKIYI